MNYFDPANGHVPTGEANGSRAAITIGAGASVIGYTQSVTTGYVPVLNPPVVAPDLLTDTFAGDDLSISVADPVSLGNFEMVFTDTAFAGAALNDIVDVAGTGITSSVVGDTIKVLVGAGVTADVYSFTIACDPSGTSSVTPEPGSFALLGNGLLGMAGITRRRLQGVAA